MSLPVVLPTSHPVIGGRYEIGEVIGRGGSATVHLGRDVWSGRSVAVKLLRAGLAEEMPFRSRLRREAQALCQLDHPAIVAVLDAGCTDPDETSVGAPLPYLVMEFIAGRSLRHVMDSGRVSLATSVHYLSGILSALDFSHRAGVVHRDFKPANVMITPTDCVKVVDFGIARLTADPAHTLTHVQGTLGTPLYLAPEQVLGEAADPRSDLYSAGCLLYELLTGRPPFVGDDPVSIAYQHVHEEAVRAGVHNQQVGPAIDDLLHKALAKDRRDRFQTAREFRQALADATSATTRFALPTKGTDHGIHHRR